MSLAPTAPLERLLTDIVGDTGVERIQPWSPSALDEPRVELLQASPSSETEAAELLRLAVRMAGERRRAAGRTGYAPEWCSTAEC